MLRLSFVNLLLVGVLLLNLFMLGTSRIRGLIQAAALQGVVLGVVLVAMAGHDSWNTAFLAIATIVIKGSVIPRLLRRALREAQIKREVEPLIGFVPTMLLGAVGTLVAVRNLTSQRVLAAVVQGHGVVAVEPQ